MKAHLWYNSIQNTHLVKYWLIITRKALKIQVFLHVLFNKKHIMYHIIFRCQIQSLVFQQFGIMAKITLAKQFCNFIDLGLWSIWCYQILAEPSGTCFQYFSFVILAVSMKGLQGTRLHSEKSSKTAFFSAFGEF